MKLLVWLAVNGLRWLTVAAVLAWANPWLGPHVVNATPPITSLSIKTIQLRPCSAWSITLGRWEHAYVCETWPVADVRWKYQRFRHR